MSVILECTLTLRHPSNTSRSPSRKIWGIRTLDDIIKKEICIPVYFTCSSLTELDREGRLLKLSVYVCVRTGETRYIIVTDHDMLETYYLWYKVKRSQTSFSNNLSNLHTLPAYFLAQYLSFKPSDVNLVSLKEAREETCVLVHTYLLT